MKNKFNNLTSKEWLPFQKSWFRFISDEELYTSHIRFFTKPHQDRPVFLYRGPQGELAEKICVKQDLSFLSWADWMDASKDDTLNGPTQYAIIDLREEIDENTTLDEYEAIKRDVVREAETLFCHMEHRRFITVFMRNVQSERSFYPYAWDLAQNLAGIFSIKDEKVACMEEPKKEVRKSWFEPEKDVFYSLNFRKDEHSGGTFSHPKLHFFSNTRQQETRENFGNGISKWFILRPRSRNKKEILHPAKYPENLVEMFLREFTGAGDNVFDPMSGTGSTQLGALKMNRNAYGTELSQFFADIARERCSEWIAPTGNNNSSGESKPECRIMVRDARQVDTSDVPAIDYVLTSPPYWDMLNMKGAENQAKRKKKGLQTSYSGDKEDLGNIADYKAFVDELTKIYLSIAGLMKPGAYMTIVVKNIKKKGRNYPFAWDLAHALQQQLILLPPVFWLQDDISIAPYGYGNTWVSNTFHQYCLTFQKP